MKKYIATIFTTVIFLTLSCKAHGQKYSTKNQKAIKYFEMAFQCYNNYDDKCALKNLELAIKTDPKFGEAYLLKAGIHKDKKEYDLAELNLLKSIECNPKEFVDAYGVLGDLYHEQFQFGKAYQAYRSYLDNDKKMKEETRIV